VLLFPSLDGGDQVFDMPMAVHAWLESTLLDSVAERL
jgi:hypothetical protein